MGLGQVLLLLALGLGCAALPAAPPPSPDRPVAPSVQIASPSAESALDPFEVAGPLGEERLPTALPVLTVRRLELPGAGAVGARRPARCDPFARRAPAKLLTCTDRASALEGLARALDERDEARRDALLVDLEDCRALAVGVARGLRAELAPIECADVLVDELVTNPPEGIDGMVHDALCGYAIAARLARTVSDPPKLDPPFERRRVAAFHAGPIAAWGRANAHAIQDLAGRAAALGFYGKAVAAVEAGMADMRFVEAVREVPLPDEIGADRELADAYYQALDGVLGPRKDRGRDAVLAGLQSLALVGVIRDGRLARARSLLSKMYGGRPIDALDPLLLPAMDAKRVQSVQGRLARALPTFYAGLLLEPERALEPEVLGALAGRGVPLAHRMALKEAALGPVQRVLYARARLEMGRAYWRASDFDEATGFLASEPPVEGDDARLLLALALALRGGPIDAAAMMRRAPLESLGLGRVAALDIIADGTAGVRDARLRAFAAFDAALLRQLTAPPEAQAGYWEAVGERFDRAAAMLVDSVARAAALERANDAREIARAISAAAGR